MKMPSAKEGIIAAPAGPGINSPAQSDQPLTAVYSVSIEEAWTSWSKP